MLSTPQRILARRHGAYPVLALLAALAATSGGPLFAQALSPEEAARRFKLAEGFEVELFASEPLVRQPVTMTFDDRGRMWVIQYLQYPTPAGLEPREVDRYLRTKYDRVPEPPPRGPRGADKITILEDTDGDGRADRAKDFVTGLNLASALALGNGGVYVGQAPYLLFYPDRDRDDVPDGDPDVLLSGFGMEDAHAVVNSLEWGPDGWLYGAQGSTVTANIRGIGFEQGIWRYHPATKRFELFSEGGGNTWGLDFDGHGNVIAGTNYGDAVCLHQVQGGYYVKNFTKHGALHNPYTFGYFEHVAHTGHVGGHVTCGGIVYQGGAFPAAFRNAYVGANLLSNAVYWSTFEPRGSTFKTRFAGTLLETDDPWFRPVDCLAGPDGSVFVADWYDQRANHVIPEDTWDKSNGRIWKIVYRGTRPAPPRDLAWITSDRLVDLVVGDNAWQARQARRLLGERRDLTALPLLRRHLANGGERAALEALWALYVSGGFDEQTALNLLTHPHADVRAWTVRFIGDDAGPLPADLFNKLLQLAADDPSPAVRSQLACTSKRLDGPQGLALVEKLLRRGEDSSDPHIPLLLWWAIEQGALAHSKLILKMLDDGQVWLLPIVHDTIVERLARRYLAEGSDAGDEACARLLGIAPRSEDRLRLVAAMDQEFTAAPLDQVPGPLVETAARLWREYPHEPTVIRLLVRLGSREAYERAVHQCLDRTQPAKVRAPLIGAVGQTGRGDALRVLVKLLDEPPPDDNAIRLAALAALTHFSDDVVVAAVLARYPSFTREQRARAVDLAAGRVAWALALVKAVEAKRIDPAEVSVDQLRAMLAHADPRLAAAIEAHWGKVRPATPGEKMSYVPVLGRVLAAAPGDLENGHALFLKHCGVCHVLHGEGTRIGPDLTAADRRDQTALLLNILDPSGSIRPEFVSQTALLNDGRVITGLVVEADDEKLTIVDAKQQKTTLARGDVDELRPSDASLMPERLLETLEPQQLRDLFRYLQSDGSQIRNARAPQ